MIKKEFVLAGRAVFTVHNSSGNHYTFKVTKKEDQNGRGDIFFLSLLSGSDNDRSYTYLGMVTKDGKIRLTRASKMGDDSLPVKVAAWALRTIWDEEEVPNGYGINHAGRCGRCGRTLTRPEGVDPEGFRFGFGPECFARMGS